jgi:hypothetical protein
MAMVMAMPSAWHRQLADLARGTRHSGVPPRRITALLCHAGWTVNHKRVERIWRREGLNDGSCIRLRPGYPEHVWTYDFVEGRTHDGRKPRLSAAGP